MICIEFDKAERKRRHGLSNLENNSGKTKKYILICAAACVLVLAAAVFFAFRNSIFGVFGAGNSSDSSVESSDSDTESIPYEEPDPRFHIKSAQALYALAESGDLENFYIINSEEPTVVVDE